MRAARSARSLSIVAALASALAVASVVACAQGTNGADDDIVTVDARRVDARPADARTVDAPFATDARQPDAGIGLDSGLPGIDAGGLPGTCTQSSECTVDFPCCLAGFGICGPDPGIPGFCT